MTRLAVPKSLLVSLTLVPLVALACVQPSPTETPEAEPTPTAPAEPETNGHAEPVSTGSQKSRGGRFALVIDGAVQGQLQSVIGGAIKAEVMTHDLGPSNAVKKNIGPPTYEPLTIRVGMGMGQQLYDWITTSFDGSYQRKNAEVHAADFDYGSQTVRKFQDALITEVAFPALDASSKEPAYMTVKVDPEEILYTRSSGKIGVSDSTGNQWQTSNFRVELGDLPTDRVVRVSSFNLKQKVSADDIGQFRDPNLTASGFEFSNISLTMGVNDIEAWQDWLQSFIVEGDSGDDSELDGSITFLGPDLVSELASVNLENVGIVSLDLPPFDANAEKVSTFTVELYVERMRFSYYGDGKVFVAPTPAPTASTLLTSTPVPQTPTPLTPTPLTVRPSAPTLILTSPQFGVIGSTTEVDYSVVDEESDLASVKASFSTDGGRTFSPATAVRRTEPTIELQTSLTGVPHTFTWDSETDLGRGFVDDVRLRLVPADSEVGSAVTTGRFAYSPIWDDVDSECDISDKEWANTFDGWDVLGDALVRCQEQMLTSFEEGLISMGDLLPYESGGPADTLAGSWDLFIPLETESNVIAKAAFSVATAGSDTQSLLDSHRNSIQLSAKLRVELENVGEDPALATVELRNLLEKQQQTLQTISNVSRMLHDTAMAVIRKIG